MSVRVIDFHLHVPVEWVRRGVNPREAAERLVGVLDEAGIDIGVVLPIAPFIPNEYVYRIVSYEPRRLIGFASVVPNPADISVRELERAVRDLGLRGLKLHPGMQGFCVRHPHVVRVLRAAGELGVPVVIHAMKGDLSTLYFKPGAGTVPSPDTIADYELLPALAPGTIIVYAHMGGLFGFREFMAIAASYPNVYLDTSYSLATIVEEIGADRLAVYIKHLGADKLVFGSDHVPGLTPSSLSARRQVEIVMGMPGLTEEEKNTILSGNARRLLGLDQG